MSKAYVKALPTISFSSVVKNDFKLSASNFMELVIPNKNFLYVKNFLSRPLCRKDLGTEVGSLNYISSSTHYFLRTKALQSHTFVPKITSETAVPIIPNCFINMNLKKGDLIISKDSNIGEIVILDKDYLNYMLSGALYKLPVQEKKYYLLALIKHKIFREQLDFMVAKGATIRHAQTKFLECKIPMPTINSDNTIKFIELLTQAIINKEQLIKERHKKILQSIETELLNNQKPPTFKFELPTINDIKRTERLDASIYCKNFQYWNFLVNNYKNGAIDLISRGFIFARGTSLGKDIIGNRIDSKKYINGFYELVLPTNINQYGCVEKSTYIGTTSKLKTIAKGDIIFGGEGSFRSMVVVEEICNVVTNGHGIRIINPKHNLSESIFIRCFLAFLHNKGIIDSISVGGNGGCCAPGYFSFINIPLFEHHVQEEIGKLYHHHASIYPDDILTLDNFLEQDNDFNQKAGIYELDKTAKQLKEILNKSIDDIVYNREVKILFK